MLYLNDILKEFKTEDNDMEIADIQLSIATTEKYSVIMKMQEFEREIEEHSEYLLTDGLTV